MEIAAGHSERDRGGSSLGNQFGEASTAVCIQRKAGRALGVSPYIYIYTLRSLFDLEIGESEQLHHSCRFNPAFCVLPCSVLKASLLTSKNAYDDQYQMVRDICNVCMYVHLSIED